MSDFDEELEDDFEDSVSSNDNGDDFEDSQQTTVTLTREINKLRQKNEVLRQFNVRQKEKYKEEVRSFLTPLIQKYKDIQGESEFLKRQIKEISQNISSVSSVKHIGENGGNGSHSEDPVRIMENTIEEKEHEISVLNKMVRSLEEEVFSLKKGTAELPELRENIKNKSEKMSKLEEENYDLSSKAEAKDSLVGKYLKQISELETNMYVLNKRLSERVGQIETGKVSEYGDKLDKANLEVDKLNTKIVSLEKQLSEYQETMSSLEEELDEDSFLKKPKSGITGNTIAKVAVGGAAAVASAMALDEIENKYLTEHSSDEKPEFENSQPYEYSDLYKDKSSEENVEEYSDDDLPSDDDLLAHNFDDMPEDTTHLVDKLLHDPENDSELEMSDLPVGEYDELDDHDDFEGMLDDSDLDLDDLPVEEENHTIDLEKKESNNPLDQFDMDDVVDEDRDTSIAKKG